MGNIVFDFDKKIKSKFFQFATKFQSNYGEINFSEKIKKNFANFGIKCQGCTFSNFCKNCKS